MAAAAWCFLHFSTASAYQTHARHRIGVIGGGASGIFSSIQAAANNQNVEVIVFESSPRTLGKVKISGGGRCNGALRYLVKLLCTVFYAEK
jgi:predicted flavoprotein YhiN